MRFARDNFRTSDSFERAFGFYPFAFALSDEQIVRMTRWRFSFVAVLFILVGCSPSHRLERDNIWISDRLHLGRQIPGGGVVSDSAWSVFLRETVTPRFPAGLTVWRTEGQWRDSTGAIIQEKTFVLELLYNESPGIEKSVLEIINEYKNRFRQETILRTRGILEVTFH